MLTFYSTLYLVLGVVLSDSVNDDSYEKMPPIPTLSSVGYPILNEQNEYFARDTTTESSKYETTTKASESTTVLTAVQFYQANWCQRMLVPSAPKAIPDSLKLSEFEEKFVIPGYRRLWYRSCYLPHRSANIASTLGEGVMDMANSVFHRIVGTANTVFDPESNVIRDMLVRPAFQ